MASSRCYKTETSSVLGKVENERGTKQGSGFAWEAVLLTSWGDNWLAWLSLLQCKAVQGAGSDKAEFFHLYFVLGVCLLSVLTDYAISRAIQFG